MLTQTKSTLELVRELGNDPSSQTLLVDPQGIAKILLASALTEGTTERSLDNAHIPGLASVILYDRIQTTIPGSGVEGGKIRLFLTKEGEHPLNRFYSPTSHDFNVHPHDHHFPLTLVPLVNNLFHLQTDEAKRGHNFNLHKFVFRTAVGKSNFGLEYKGLQRLELPDKLKLVPGDTCHLTSDQIHSVTPYEVAENGVTAWMVIEGPKEDKDTLLFSTEATPIMDADGLYKPASRSFVDQTITDVLMRMDRGY